MLNKRDLANLSAADIMNHVWQDVGPTEGVSLTDRFTVDALCQLCEHKEWEQFPSYFRDWVVDTVDDILNNVQ